MFVNVVRIVFVLIVLCHAWSSDDCVGANGTIGEDGRCILGPQSPCDPDLKDQTVSCGSNLMCSHDSLSCEWLGTEPCKIMWSSPVVHGAPNTSMCQRVVVGAAGSGCPYTVGHVQLVDCNLRCPHWRGGPCSTPHIRREKVQIDGRWSVCRRADDGSYIHVMSDVPVRNVHSAQLEMWTVDPERPLHYSGDLSWRDATCDRYDPYKSDAMRHAILRRRCGECTDEHAECNFDSGICECARGYVMIRGECVRDTDGSACACTTEPGSSGEFDIVALCTIAVAFLLVCSFAIVIRRYRQSPAIVYSPFPSKIVERDTPEESEWVNGMNHYPSTVLYAVGDDAHSVITEVDMIEDGGAQYINSANVYN